MSERPLRVTVLTTSYPRFPGDAAGRFVGDGVDHLRRHGHEVTVVSPRDFSHFGIAYGAGVVGNLRQKPWKLLLLPLMLGAFVRAARRAARDADVVHAHWIPAGAVALATRRPFVLQLWGTDAELAGRVPALARRIVARAEVVVCASQALAESARRLGARTVRVIPAGVSIPDSVGPEDQPPTVLFAGRLSPEKGILELLEAARGLPLVVVGDGPLRPRVPQARGFVPHGELEVLYERAAVVCVPSRREGFGMVCLEAMAYGRPVVASAVGGLLDLVVDGETGLLVQAGDVPALRAALLRLLHNAPLRRQMGEAARTQARRFSWETVVAETLDVYRHAVRSGR